MSDQPVIQLLSDQVINKIAAGEVVERPASVLKELLENALDAGASHVDIEIVRGGRQLIAVTDNGCGMNRDQALLSIERHATSKIRSEADIESIHTLGFRGEALAAIASVSRFRMETRPADDLSGTALEITGGRMLACDDTGCPVGTRMEVRNLFFNVPARRKFLRAEQTETAHIRQLFIVHALAHPDVGMRLMIDERTAYNLPPGGSLKDRIGTLYPAGFMNELRRVDHEDAEARVTGFAGLPQTARKDRKDQFIFVNGRPASAPVVYHAVTEAYQSVMGRGRHPALILFLELDPEQVDVNVHPTKKEVRFRRPNQLRDAVAAALQAALSLERETPARPETDEEPISLPTPQPPRLETQRKMDDLLVRPDTVLNHRRDRPALTEPAAMPQSPIDPPAAPVAPPELVPSIQSPWSWCRVVGRIGNRYVLLETDDGYVVMEPHAAHERVLFEKLMKTAADASVEQQQLLAPEAVELLPSDAETVRRHLPVLEELGFGVSDFGGDSFMVDALPPLMAGLPPAPLLTEIARELETAGTRKAARELIRDRIAQATCRMAVRSGERLSDPEIEKLVRDLALTEMPYTSPRGRPTLIFTSFAELDRKFSRD